MVFRAINAAMAVLFAFAVAVQYNDPDPVRWMLIYAAACAVSLITAVRGTAPPLASAAVGIVALGWAILWAVGNPHPVQVYTHMFDSWEMKSAPIEEARETSGLAIVTVWMAVVTIGNWRNAPRVSRKTVNAHLPESFSKGRSSSGMRS